MKCPNCGAPVHESSAKSCEYCGAVVTRPGRSAGRRGDPFDVFKDADGDGTPDIFEDASGVSRTESVSTTYTFNGVTYESLDEMPPEVRRRFESTMRSLGDLGIGGTTNADEFDVPDDDDPDREYRRAATHRRRRFAQADAEETQRRNRMWLVVFLVLVGVAAAVALLVSR